MVSIINFSTSTLLSYYQAQLNTTLAGTSNQAAAASSNSTSNSASSSSKSATANDVLPWSQTTPSQEVEDANVLETTNFIDTSKVPLLSGYTSDTKTEQDNQKLFALYTAVNNLSYLASMSTRDGTTAGQMAGYNTRFQTGLSQIEAFVNNETFNNFSLQTAAASSSVTASTAVPTATFGFTGGSVVADADIDEAVPGLSPSQSFTIAVTTNDGTTNNVDIDLSKVNGPLTLDNVVDYANQQLKAAGYDSRLSRVMTDGTIDDITNSSWGIGIDTGAGESLSFSSSGATPAIYLANTSGLTVGTSTAAADSQGRLVKLTDLDNLQTDFSRTVTPTNGTSTAASTVVDADGNVYMIGSATGDFSSQLNQGSQDVYLTKYDSAGNQQWTSLLGSADTASGMSLAALPTGGVVVVGSTTSDLTTTAVASGNTDSFVTKYSDTGEQVWTSQIQTVNQNQANAVSVDASGNIYVGGQVTGAIAAGQSKIGGSDAYIAKLDSKGNVVYEQQLGTAADDSVAATAITDSGDLIVATMQGSHAVLSKYTGGDATQAPAWQMDLGDLQDGGTIGGVTVSGDKIYVSGTSQNTALNQNVVNPSSGGTDAFVIAATDNNTSATADFVSYVGTATQDMGGAVTTGPDGTVYLTGTTKGTFANQERNVDTVANMFVAAMGSDGQMKWVRQYGGMDGQSSGQGIAVDPTGSSVLDALGLPRGTINTSQTSDLTSATTLRAGDSFQIAIQGSAARTFTITADQGETVQSLANKINIEFGTMGTASVNYGANGASLKIQVASGLTAKLISGPTGFDALARLGISPCTLTAASTTSSSSSSTSSSSSSDTSSTSQTFGLGLVTNLDISTADGAQNAQTQLAAVLNSVRYAYQQTNTPAGSTSSTSTASTTTSSTTALAYLQSQASGYSLALSILGSTSSTSSSSSTSLFA